MSTVRGPRNGHLGPAWLHTRRDNAPLIHEPVLPGPLASMRLGRGIKEGGIRTTIPDPQNFRTQRKPPLRSHNPIAAFQQRIHTFSILAISLSFMFSLPKCDGYSLLRSVPRGSEPGRGPQCAAGATGARVPCDGGVQGVGRRAFLRTEGTSNPPGGGGEKFPAQQLPRCRSWPCWERIWVPIPTESHNFNSIAIQLFFSPQRFVPIKEYHIRNMQYLRRDYCHLILNFFKLKFSCFYRPRNKLRLSPQRSFCTASPQPRAAF